MGVRVPRWVLLLAVVFLAASLVTGTSGVSASTLDRGVQGAVVSDNAAYLGINQSFTASGGNVSVTNQFSSGTFLDVTVRVNGTTKTISGLGSGETGNVSFTGDDCGAGMWVNATGDSVQVNATRTVSC